MTARWAEGLGSRLRAWSGLVLFAYVTCHLINHALGLISLDAMVAAKNWAFVVWHSQLGATAVLVALIVHAGLALWQLATRPALRLAGWQWVQLALGLLLTIVLAEHLAGTVMLEARTETRVTYELVLLAIWPEKALIYAAFLLAVWVHGCIGLHHWWRLDRRYRLAQTPLLAFAVAVPALAIGGMVAAARDAAARAPVEAPAWAAAYEWGDLEATRTLVAEGRTTVLAFVFGGLALALLWRLGRAILRRRNEVVITYPFDHRVRAQRGLTLLEISREAGIPHAAVCGGRARCSTCRVRVTRGRETLPPPAGPEARLLARLGHPEAVRLACQLRPTQPLAVVPIVPPAVALADARSDADPGLGREREVVVLFADLRGFTQLSEQRLPYDVVYLLNQYFRAMGEVIEHGSGHVDKFLGDGLMALFGLRTEPTAAATSALRVAGEMAVRLRRLNDDLAAELESPLRIAMGMHQGAAIVGEMGHGRARQLTAVGDTVNVASRLETLAKSHDVQLAVSEVVVERAGLTAGEPMFVDLRGRTAVLGVHLVDDAAILSADRHDTPTIGSDAAPKAHA
ncbi:MAG: adenylate/guanylate cyclase domain-containing protein [Pseudomonadota bacterium]